jgi:endonuclease/exonuclease/phosphatase (EEP) superfamily protein YafD
VAKAAGALSCVCTITGLLGAYGWLLDLTSHFRVQYAVLLSVIAGALCVRRQFRIAAVFGVFALLNFGLVAPLYFGKPAGLTAASQKLRVLLVNVDTSNRHYDWVNALIREKDPDLLVLEEVDERWLNELKQLSGGYPHAITAPRDDNFGIALFSKRQLLRSNVVYLGEAEVPSVEVEIQVSTKRVTIVGTHPLPPGSREYARLRNEQLAALAKFLADRTRPIILLGDLNATPWSVQFKRLVRATGLSDSSQGRGLHATWPANFFPLRIPIDHCLVSSDLTVLNKQVGRKVGSDHLPVIVELSVPQ